MLTQEEIGKKIRDLRVRKSISQVDLAKAIGLESHAAISDIERGKTNLKINQLQKIADFFSMTIEDILNSQVITTHTTQYRESKDMTKEDKAKSLKDMKGFWERVEQYKKKK